MHESIAAWSGEAGVLPAIDWDVQAVGLKSRLAERLGQEQVEAMICINMIHISAWTCTLALFNTAGEILISGGFLLTYGPYRVNGLMVESNIKFDENLRARSPDWGVRDLEEVAKAAESCGLILERTHEMPANNLCVVFRKL